MTRLTLRAGLGTAVASLLLAGCGPVIGGGDDGGSAADDRPVTQVPTLADVTPLEDPRSWDGLVDLNLPDPEIVPVEDDPQPQLPVTVTDAQGEQVTVTDVSRILALDLYGTLAHTVYDLGLGDNIVGRDISSSFPEIADKPVVTENGHELNVEAILELDPSVVLTDTTLGVDVPNQLKDAGIPVVYTDSTRSTDNIASLTQEVADALGVPEAGQALGARIEQQVADTTEQIAEVAPQDVTGQLRTVFLYVRGQAGVYYMFGEGSGADSLIKGAGGYDVAEEIGWSGMKPVTDEALLEAGPDVLLMMSKGLESVGGVDGLLERFPALASTPAGQHERIVAMDDDVVLSFGPRTADVLNALAVALYAPDAL